MDAADRLPERAYTSGVSGFGSMRLNCIRGLYQLNRTADVGGLSHVVGRVLETRLWRRCASEMHQKSLVVIFKFWRLRQRKVVDVQSWQVVALPLQS